MDRLVDLWLGCSFYRSTILHEVEPDYFVVTGLWRIRDLLFAFRETGVPIIHIVRLYEPDGSNVELCRRTLFEQGRRLVSPGTKGAELVSDLKPDADTEINSPMLLSGGLQDVGKLEWIIYYKKIIKQQK